MNPTERPSGPRIHPRGDDDLDEMSRDLVARGTGDDAPPAHNLIRTMAWNPGLLRRWMPYGGRLLLGGKLPARSRELCILRVAVRTRSDYEWSQHVPIALEAGIEQAEIDAVAGLGQAAFSAIDGAMLTAVDELVDTAAISSDTWTTLADAFEPNQLVELPLLVAAYLGVAFLANSVGIQVEPGLTGLP